MRVQQIPFLRSQPNSLIRSGATALDISSVNSYNGRVSDRDHAQIVTFVMPSVHPSPNTVPRSRTSALAADSYPCIILTEELDDFARKQADAVYKAQCLTTDLTWTLKRNTLVVHYSVSSFAQFCSGSGATPWQCRTKVPCLVPRHRAINRHLYRLVLLFLEVFSK